MSQTARRNIARSEEGAETPSGSLAALSFGALGIVFGDVGTSPLYAFKSVLGAAKHPVPETIYGSVSLIIWTLILIAAVKYVTIAMRFDYKGEGGILALLSLLQSKKPQSALVFGIALFGSALIFGDGAITPAISVLSALEGVKQMEPALAPYVLPTAVVILLALFAFQPMGTASIGKAFGPVMFLWFFALGALGLHGIIQHPGVLAAFNPYYGARYLISGGSESFIVLGSVFLCVTGAEALYADMGHFGVKPIRLAFYGMVLPCLLLNYMGQAAIVLAGAPTQGNIFYRLCPSALLGPMIILSTLATIIASQAIITGSFSMTRQAINLGWLPRLALKQTSAKGYGQIYIGSVNWIMMIVTLILTISFGKSESLAAAYGIAVSQTMLFTSILLFLAMRQVWQWPVWQAGVVAGIFCLIDMAFLTSNMSKLFAGGYVPIAIAAVIFWIMWLWHKGATTAQKYYVKIDQTSETVLQRLNSSEIVRTPGLGVFFTRDEEFAPKTLVWQMDYNHALPEKIIAFHLKFLKKPYVPDEERLSYEELAPNVWRAHLQYGFMEQPDIEKTLHVISNGGCPINPAEAHYYIGHETIMRRRDRQGLSTWSYKIFSAMERNTFHFSEIIVVPFEKIIEVRRQIPV